MPAPVFVIAFANNLADADRHLPALDAEFERLRAVLGDQGAEPRWELVPSPQTSIRHFLDLLEEARYQRRIALLHFAGHASGKALLLESESGAPEVANAAGLAEFLAQHDGLGFLFLNACSTVGQVQALLAAGVPAIIATEHDINDAVATEFSSRFYKEFVNGQTLRKAFDAASAAVKTNLTLRNAAQSRSISDVGEARDPDDWPWKLHVRDGNKNADQWSLGIALDDPLWGVPEPAARSLPDAPFRHLLPFSAEHAAIFFGRRRETREVYDAIERGDARRVVLLHGVSGAGKSSLLDAGLLPRLERTRTVVYRRRSPEQSLLGNLRAMLGVSDATAGSTAPSTVLSDAWKQRETSDRPLTIILDQVEEALGDPNRDGKKELAELVDALKQIFDQAAPPTGSIVLGFRKEWLADVQNQLEQARLASTSVFLDRLGERGIVEAVEGVTRNATLRAHYGLTIPDEDAGLAKEIADDLLVDASSAIAPTLQVLLTRMWERAMPVNGAHTFTRALYRSLVSEGVLLKDFVDQQVEKVRAAVPAAEQSGLVLDLLAFHANEMGDATRFRSSAERVSRYPVALQQDVSRIVDVASAGRLMAVTPEATPDTQSTAQATMQATTQATTQATKQGATRLGHDTLARYVRQLQLHSGKPVQRALRIIEERAPEWEEGGMRRTLNAADLALVERGLSGMRVLKATEQALIDASRAEMRHAQAVRRRIRVAFVAAALLIAVAGGVAWWLGKQATLQAHRATVQALLSSAVNASDPLEATLMLASLAHETEEPPGAVQAALQVLARPVPVAVLAGHTGFITVAAFSPDGTHILTASTDSTARIWSRDGSTPPVVLRGHTGGIVDARFTPDGQHVITASDDSTVRIWMSSGAGTPVVLHHDGALTSVACTPDGRWIVAADTHNAARTGSVVRVWHADGSGTPILLRGHAGPALRVYASPDSKHVLSVSGDHSARVWSVDGTGTPFVFKGHSGAVLDAAFSDDGRRVVSGADGDKAMVWSADGSRPPVVLPSTSPSGSTVAFSPKHDLVAIGTTSNIAEVWSATGQGKPYELRGHNGQIMSLAFSRDGLHVLTASADGSARLFTLDGHGATIVFGGHTGIVRSASFSADERWIVTAGNDGTARIWRSEAPEPARQLVQQKEPILWGEYSPDGARVVAAVASRALVLPVNGGGDTIALTGHADNVVSATFSRDGQRVVTASSDQTARVWQLSRANGTAPDSTSAHVRTIDSAIAVFDEMTGQVTSAHFSPDGQLVATTNTDGEARVYRLASFSTGVKPIAEFSDHTASVLTAAFSADGKHLVTGSEDLTARLWTLDGSVAPLVLRGFQGSVLHAAFSRDGAWMALSSDDATTRIYKGDGTGVPMVLRGHSGEVNDAEFSPDGQLVVTASSDGTARISRRDGTGVPIVLAGHTARVSSASFSPSGHEVLTTSADGTARIWPITWPALLQQLEVSTTACLTAEQRTRLLGESPRAAAANVQSCATHRSANPRNAATPALHTP